MNPGSAYTLIGFTKGKTPYRNVGYVVGEILIGFDSDLSSSFKGI